MALAFREGAACKDAGITYHLAVEEEWEAQRNGASYAPPQFADEGFIHCTNGLDRLTEIANMFYREDPRPRTILVIDLLQLKSDFRYDDPNEEFPHIYGEINPNAVIGELAVFRKENGEFQIPGE